jgi:hypothetical protein
MPKATAPINAFNAGNIGVQTLFPQFFEVIRNHKAFNLYFQFSVCLTQPPGEGNQAGRILKEYATEKKKLMKELQIYKHICKQPGSAIDTFMWKEHNATPRLPYVPTPIHAYEDCPNPEECNQCIRPV